MTSEQPIGILVMAYGTAAGADDIERYYTDIRGGRPPSGEHLAELRSRYAAIGDRFPLLEITRAQAAGLEAALNRDDTGRFRCYLGMKHSPPWIADAVAKMRTDGIERAVGIVMAPHWSAMSIATYAERVESATASGGSPAFSGPDRAARRTRSRSPRHALGRCARGRDGRFLRAQPSRAGRGRRIEQMRAVPRRRMCGRVPVRCRAGRDGGPRCSEDRTRPVRHGMAERGTDRGSMVGAADR